MDSVLRGWLQYKATESALYKSSELSDASTSQRFNHPRVEALFSESLSADKGATYAKQFFIDLSTLSPYVSGPNSVKVATPLDKLSPQGIRIDKAYLVSCTNSRASDLAAAAKVFKDAAEKNGGRIPRIAEGVEFYIAAASLPEQMAAEAAGDWDAMLDAGAKPLPAGCGPCIGLGTGLLKPGEVGISASNRNFKGRMGSTDAKAYLASPSVVASSALSGQITGPDWYNRPEGWSGVAMGEGDGMTEGFLQKISRQILQGGANQWYRWYKERNEKRAWNAEYTDRLTSILPGFPEMVRGEIVFCDADNINTDGIYPGKYTYTDNVPVEKMAEVCMSNYDPVFSSTAQANDILVSGFNFGCGSSREQAATAILAKKIPLVVAGSFGNIFSRNSINNALMGVEVPRLVQRLRETFSNPHINGSQEDITEPSLNNDSLDTPPSAPPIISKQEKLLTRRTGWTLEWDVKRSKVIVQEGKGGAVWSQKVGELPPNVQEIIARGGLEKWVKKEIEVAA